MVANRNQNQDDRPRSLRVAQGFNVTPGWRAHNDHLFLAQLLVRAMSLKRSIYRDRTY
jgi:hypothetical protein